MKRLLIPLLLVLAGLAGLRVPVDATVNSSTNRIAYAGNGSTKAFSFPYRFIKNADLIVYLRNESTYAESLQTITTHYTVTGAGSSSGGTVTFVTAPPTGTSVVIFREPDRLQDLDLRENSALPADELEFRLDKLTLDVQRLHERADRSLRMTDGNTKTFDMRLPANLTANGIPVINSTADGWMLSTLSASAADLAALTGGGNTTLHYHDADRARAFHTGTQTASTISDFTSTVEGIATATPTASKIVKAGAGGTIDPLWLAGIANAQISATAAIAYSKLNLANAIVTGDIVDGTIVDADISASAAIAYSKLSLAASITSADLVDGTIVNADVNASAAIAYSKLALSNSIVTGDIVDGTITNADLNASIGIPYSKLSLANSIVTGDILDGTLLYADIQNQSAGTILARGSDQGSGPPQALTIGAGLSSAGGQLQAVGGAATITVKEGGVTVGGASFNTLDFSADDFDIAESPANTATIVLATNSVESATIQDDTIVNADVNSAAAIAYSKLALSASIVVGDLATALANRVNSATATAGGIVYGNGTNYSTTSAFTSGQLVTSGGSGAPTGTTIGQGLSLNGGATLSRSSLTEDYNALINSYFDVWQRNTSFTPAAATFTFCPDRFRINIGTGGVATISRQAHTAGEPLGSGNGEPQYFLRWNQTTGGTGSVTISQPVESVRTFANTQVTMIVIAKVSSGTMNVTPSLVQKFGTGGSPSSDVVLANSPVTLTTSFAKYSSTFTLGSISGKTLGTNGDDCVDVRLGMPASTTFTVDIGAIALVPGAVAVDIPRRFLQREIALCQRRHCKSFNMSVAEAQNVGADTAGNVSNRASGTGVYVGVHFPVEMASTPTITFYSPNAATSAWQGTGTPASSSAAVGTSGFSAVASSGCTDQNVYQVNWSADCELNP